MKKIIFTLKHHLLHEVRPWQMVLSFLFLAGLVYLEYSFELKKSFIRADSDRFLVFAQYFLFYGIPYLGAFLLLFLFSNNKAYAKPKFWLLFLIALVSFSGRGSAFFTREMIESFSPGLDSWYWMKAMNNFLLGPLLCFLPLCYYMFERSDTGIHGFKFKDIDFKPYIIMLLLMLPLIASASGNKDFYTYYPRVARAMAETTENHSSKMVFFEFAYGWDFIWIELFFRGFLVLAFASLLGTDAILPMAVFYCSIHFGKPLGETISSFFGGYLLGLVVYHTQSVIGGAIVHIGIAWLMEIGGFAGRYLNGEL